jgi:hypothetical protein
VLRDFHPVTTKLVSSRGRKHKVVGSYFDQGLATTQVAFSKYSSGGGGAAGTAGAGAEARQQQQQLLLAVAGGGDGCGDRTAAAAAGMSLAAFAGCDVRELQGRGLVLLKRWTLAEVVSEVAAAGLRLVALEEEPNEFPDHRELPKTFTVVAVKE